MAEKNLQDGKILPQIYGLMAEFETPEQLLRAARRAREAGYRNMDAFSPFPIEGLNEEVGFRRTGLPAIVLIAGTVGALTGFGLQYWVSKITYPLNVGGRPLNSWPAFIPVTFEVTILFAALAAVIGMIALNGLPMPYHPAFGVPRFAQASQNRFFLAIEATDPKFDRKETRNFLEALHPFAVNEVDL
ncbi:MAG TPA: DUF3341 domain-containing protein [Acidobacteriota bacterium]|nr:DUF3341 domain-containing protein [Acidobacteriota bacterium]